MKIDYDGEQYDLDLEEMTLKQMDVIKKETGLNMLSLNEGLNQFDPDALRALYWLMLVTSGRRADIRNLDFKVVKFAHALEAALEAEADAQEAEAKEASKGKKKTVVTPLVKTS